MEVEEWRSGCLLSCFCETGGEEKWNIGDRNWIEVEDVRVNCLGNSTV